MYVILKNKILNKCLIYISFDHTPFLDNDIYSVMQSDKNRFCGDVVLDSFNIAYKDEDNILDQIYKKQIGSKFCIMILIFHSTFSPITLNFKSL